MQPQLLRDNPGFVVEETAAPPTEQNAVATKMLMIALGALSQRVVVALASLFSILLAGSVFALFWAVLPNPSYNSLLGVGMYAVFVLALHLVRLKK
jgi:hypothetical protein